MTTPRPRSADHRRRSALPALLLAALLMAACGGGGSGSGSGGGSGSTSEPATEGAASGAFPTTVTTAFGDVTVEEEPERVVALGWGDAETALVLGVQPVGASDWLAWGDEGVGPWLEGAYDEAPTILGTTDVSVEAVAALQPDLILDTRSDGTQERYDSLSRVAPVVGAPEGAVAYGTTWQQQLELVGQALGRSEQAQEAVEQTEADISAVAEAHPDLQGRRMAVGAYTSQGYGAYVQGDARVELLEQLGLVNSPAVDELATGSFFVPVSEERLDLLDADVTVVFPIFVAASEFTGDPLWQAVPSVADGRALVLEDTGLTNAFSSGTAPGTAYAAEQIAPLVSEALAGGA